MLDSELNDKIYIHNKFGDTVDFFDQSKLVFMGDLYSTMVTKTL